MKVAILCGGRGTRMGDDETPKALVVIGGRPILWHIMKIYSYYGFNDFILCLGYKGDKIKEYFRKFKKWNIEFVNTGVDTNTGGRISKIRDHIKEQHFFVTYGDGLANVNINNLFSFHKTKNKIVTLTVVKPRSQFGIVNINSNNVVTDFKEKPLLDFWINGGFFVFNKDIFSYFKDSDILEKDTFDRLIKFEGLSAYKHRGFWMCMDTYKDSLILNQLWQGGAVPWAIWRNNKR